MTYTTDPVLCPNEKCGAQIADYKSVVTLTRVTGMVIVACAACRTVLGVLPPEA